MHFRLSSSELPVNEMNLKKYDTKDLEDIVDVPIMSQIYESMGLSYAKGRGVLENLADARLRKNSRMIKMTLTRENNECYIENPKKFTEKPSTNLEKVHFIIGSGIAKAGFHDSFMTHTGLLMYMSHQ